jgi:Uma2 family endonuclease
MTTEATIAKSTRAIEPQAVPLRLSYQEYLAWDYECGITEWVDGEVIFHMPPKRAHQQIVAFLDRLLGVFVEMFNLGVVQIAPFTMRLIESGSAREPDLFFLANENLERYTEIELVGPADLIVEVISEDSVARDRGDKFYEYQEAGVREYWIIDPRPGKQRVDLYVLSVDGRYQPVLATADNIYHSAILTNFWLKEAWLWSEKPNPLAALTEIVGMERVIAALREQA